MELVDEEGRALALFGLTAGGTGTGTGRIVLLVPFSSAMPATLENLERLARAAAELGRAGIAPLALSLDGAAGAVAAGAALRARGWQHPWASATPEALERLDALQALLLDHERRLALPASFLVDPSGALRVLYTGAVDAQRVLADRELCALADGAELEAAVPFPGRWMFPEIPSDADFFEGRLRARGLDGAAAEFARGRLTLVRSAPADLLHEFGREAALAGRFDDAQKFFQRALAADPRHFRALSDWAVVLHRGGELALAAELYGKALALDPEHADTRFNLALALLGLGDRAGAENQLRWLQARKVESAAVLERALRELTAPK
jgi:tetratricopeptide (TPR) repeat protein